jgi:hypothetical protein
MADVCRRCMQGAMTWAVVAGVAALAGCASAGHANRAHTERAEAHPPVVFVSFDEFSTTSLVDGRGRIDPVRYPNFAALARDGNWFPYATAPADQTGRAMGALLTGNLPDRGTRATYGDNPRNLFTLLSRSYGIRASEEVTSLCPRPLCPGVRRQTKRSVLHKLGTGRADRFARWLRSVRGTRRPTLFFKHVLLPHGPWRYLTDGREYLRHEPVPDWGHAFSVPWVSTQKYQRHLVQVGFADRLLGSLIARLKAQGLYDRALIVVTADNGEGFGRIGNGHEVTGRNAGDIALTPLIVKAPFQHDGAAPRRHVRTVDVLPTIARIAGVRPRWPMQGHPLYGPQARRIPSTATVFQRSGRKFRFSPAALRRWAVGARRIKLRLFGSGDPASLYRIGPYRKLLGTEPSNWAAAAGGKARATLNDPAVFRAVRLKAHFLPAYASGRVTGARPPAAVAVALNGRIEATSPTYRVHRRGALYFSALLPSSALRKGANQVRLYGVSGPAGAPRLRALGS